MDMLSSDHPLGPVVPFARGRQALVCALGISATLAFDVEATVGAEEPAGLGKMMVLGSLRRDNFDPGWQLFLSEPSHAADDCDRGIHMLVGEEHHRDPHKVTAWPGSPIHYLFLDEPRTRRIVCEPCADSARTIRHLQTLGCARLKEFDFSRKRAALRVPEREAFLARSRLA